MYKACIVLFSLLIFSMALPCYGGARFSGTIVSIQPANGVLVLQLADGSKKKIVMEKSSTYLKGGSTASLASFKNGEHAVASITSPLNDDPLKADSLMDSLNARQTAPAAYTPSNSRVGGYATSAGPGATGGTTPNVIAGIATSGGSFMNPPNVLNAPFTASPAVAQSPCTGAVITGQQTSQPQPLITGQQAPQPLITSQNTTAGRNFTASPAALNSPQTGQALTGGPPSAAAGSMITGQHSGDTSPMNMMLEPQAGKATDPYGGNNPALITGENDEEDDENQVSMFNNSEQQSAAGSPCQVNARVMDINLANRVIFYMVVGSQDLGSAVITPRTQIIDGQTRQPLTLQTLPKGCFVVVNGVQRGGNCLEAASIVIVKR